jgi:hypothetical protein
MTGMYKNKPEFINIIQQWDEVIFPGTETSIVTRASDDDARNEIDRERMEDEDNEPSTVLPVTEVTV